MTQPTKQFTDDQVIEFVREMEAVPGDWWLSDQTTKALEMISYLHECLISTRKQNSKSSQIDCMYMFNGCAYPVHCKTDGKCIAKERD